MIMQRWQHHFLESGGFASAKKEEERRRTKTDGRIVKKNLWSRSNHQSSSIGDGWLHISIDLDRGRQANNTSTMQVHKRNAAFFLLSVAIILVSTPVGAFQHPTRSVPRFATNPTKRFPIRYDGKASRAPTRAPFSSIDDSRKKASRVALFSTAMGPGGLHPMAWYSMSMLALQFGTQPILVRKFMPKSICRSTVVLAQEVAKVILGGILLWATGGWASSVAGT